MSKDEKVVSVASDTPQNEKPICFVIMPISDPEGYAKGHFLKIYEQIFKVAIEQAGYTAHRVDENAESTLIQGKILEQLVNAPMVLCDLSTRNPNVLYELGMRHAYDKPIVLVQECGTERIFDIAGISTVDYRKERLYDEATEDQQKICNAIVQTASSRKNYSIVQLAKLSPAVLDGTKNITKDDRLEILFEDMSKKMNDIDDKLSMWQQERIVNESSFLKENPKSKSNGKFYITVGKEVETLELLEYLTHARKIIDKCRLNRDAVSRDEIVDSFVNLSNMYNKFKVRMDFPLNNSTEKSIKYALGTMQKLLDG